MNAKEVEALLEQSVPPVQDYIILNGFRSPGKAIVAGATTPRKWDQRPGYGFTGATVFYTGQGLAEFTVTLELWDPREWQDWWAFARVLEKEPIGKRAAALKISHPLLTRAPLNITDVVVTDVSQWEQDDDGLWTCTISFLEYRPPKPAVGKPTAAIPDSPQGKVAAKTAIEIENEKLTKELADLSGQL